MKSELIGCVGGRIRTANITNMVTNGNFVNGSGWTGTGAAFSVSANTGSFLANSAQDTLSQLKSLVSGRKYYVCANVRAYSSGIQLILNDGVNIVAVDHPGTGVYARLSFVFTAVNTNVNGALYLIDWRSSGWNYIDVQYVSVAELTTPFGAGNEPTKSDMDAEVGKMPYGWINGTQSITLYD